jgi:phosphomannomutase
VAEPGDIQARVAAWVADDPDPETRAEAAAMLERGDTAALAVCFGPPPAFGTAGLRAPLGPGPSRMNRATVRRIAAALVGALAEHVPGDGPVVIGFDGRRGSRAFAEDVARVVTGAGLRAMRFAEVCPTPVLAFAVRALGGRAGVMITASHNPPADNGVKVYGPDGAQIVAPFDAAIAARLASLERSAALALGSDGEPVPDSVREDYAAAILGNRIDRPPSTLRIVYTPLHGVGADTVLRVLAAAGHTDLHVVPEQAEPDGAFPTLAFPNPEEPGALSLAVALAERVDAPLILANDPDADRIAAAVRLPDGGYRALTGNEIGTLLAEDLLAASDAAGEPRLVATTVVSSSLLAKIADHHGAAYAETLTGFKWITRARATSDAAFVLGYEEALGVCVGDVVRDKDGVSAALLLADLAAHLALRGETLLDAIEALHRRHGVHAGGQVTLTLPGEVGRRRIAAVMAALRSAPPARIGDVPVETWVDHLRPGLSGDAAPRASSLPPADLVVAHLRGWGPPTSPEGGARVLFRPSGTEPKLKAYLEVVVPVGPTGTADATARAAARLSALEGAVRSLLTALSPGQVG